MSGSEFLDNVAGDYPDYLRDESRRAGTAETISFPRSESDVRAVLEMARARCVPVTIQAARTGITAGSVPEGGHILNLSRMNRILDIRRGEEGTDEFFLTVESGVLLSEVRDAVARKQWDGDAAIPGQDALRDFGDAGEYFFPPDPTEWSAAIGGMVGCNASGARSFAYGPTRNYVQKLRVVLADGSLLELRRGSDKAIGRHFSLTADPGQAIAGVLPSYTLPDVKNASGYYARDDMDLVDLFVGAEGTLGVVTEIELRLVPMPAAVWGVMAFFPSEEGAITFVKMAKAQTLRPVAVEFFDSHALDLLRGQRETNPAFGGIAEMPPAWHTGIYVEYHATDEDAAETAVMDMAAMMVECGGDENDTWIVSDARAMERLKTFRHALPEAVNLRIDERRKSDPDIAKLGTDLSVPDASLDDVVALYHADLDRAGLEFVMFGHIGHNHIHVNIIPRNVEEYRRGRELYGGWARAVVAMGGSVSAEHGIGKIKRELLREMYGEKGISEMIAVKRLFDPQWMLNRGNLFLPPAVV